MIYPPVAMDDEDETWYSVQVDLPHEVEADIQRYVDEDGGASWTVAIHGALYGYRATVWSPQALRDELSAMLQVGLDGTEAKQATEVTPEFWEELKQRGRESIKRMQELRAVGKLGNLLLPRELYEFIKSEILAGKFSSPTEVVCSAMPNLRSPN